MKLGNDFSGALRTFAYFMASGTHYMIEDIDYIDMNINDEEFVAVCDDVLNALEKNNVAQKEKDEVLCILYSMKGEIVGV